MSKKNILIFPCGAENAIEIYDSLRYNVNFNIFGATSRKDYSSYMFDEEFFILDNLNINNDDFFEKFNKHIDKNNIDLVIPTHDTIALFLMENRDKINAKIVSSDVETAKICRNKKMTYNVFKDDYFAPKVYNNLDEIKVLPAFCKPNIGEGAKGVKVLKTLEECSEEVGYDNDNIILEYLPGEEYTVDCFTDRKGNLLFSGARTRNRITMGISFSTRSVKNSKIDDIAKIINNKLKLRGAWFFQVKEDINGELKLLEVSVRQAGTMALYRQNGINFALLSVFDAMDMDVKILDNDIEVELERKLYNKYKLNFEFDKAYIDYDDTLIINNKVNTEVLTFIYKCINENKKVILITKHEFDFEASLKKFRISRDMFDEVLHLDIDDKKYKYIDSEKSILIDNYFMERNQAKEKLGIPVFDVDAVSCLI